MLGATAARFGIVGVLNSLVGLATIYLAKWAIGLGDVHANLLGYSVGLLCSFLLNRQFTFNSSAAYGPALMRFLAVVGVAYLANLGVVLIAARALLWNSYVAQAAGVIPYATITYFGCRLFVFRADSQ